MIIIALCFMLGFLTSLLQKLKSYKNFKNSIDEYTPQISDFFKRKRLQSLSTVFLTYLPTILVLLIILNNHTELRFSVNLVVLIGTSLLCTIASIAILIKQEKIVHTLGQIEQYCYLRYPTHLKDQVELDYKNTYKKEVFYSALLYLVWLCFLTINGVLIV